MALTSQLEIWPNVSSALTVSLRHAPSAILRLLLWTNTPGGAGGGGDGVCGVAGGKSKGGSGGNAGGKKGVLHQAEAHESLFELAHAEGVWAMKLVWMSSLLQSLKGFPKNIYCAATEGPLVEHACTKSHPSRAKSHPLQPKRRQRRTYMLVTWPTSHAATGWLKAVAK